MSLISSNIKYLRRINGLTQEQFARRIGTKRANVGAYEESRAVPPVDLLKIIANTFGISVDDLVKKDVRKIRETPDITFNFDPKPVNITPSQPPASNPIVESDPFHNFHFNQDTELSNTSSIGDLLKKYMGESSINEKPPQVRPPQPDFLTPTMSPPTPQPPAEVSVPYATPNSNYFNPLLTQNIQLVRRNQFNEYLLKHSDFYFLKTLPPFNIPGFEVGEYRAFEAGEDFAYPGAILVGALVRNWQEIRDGKNYVIVSKNHGIIYRRAYNQIQLKGTLLLSTDNNRYPGIEIPIVDIFETWEIKSFISFVLPEPVMPFNKIGNLVDELKSELEKIKK